MTIKNGDMPAMPITLKDGEVWSEDCNYANGLAKREMMAMHMMAEMTETKRLRQIWRQLRSHGSRQGFDMDYKFLRSCVHYSAV